MKIVPGTVFDTPFEKGCIALTAPDRMGCFDGHDSEGVLCAFTDPSVVEGAMPLTPHEQSANADRRRFIVRYGMPGHEYEYCVNIEGYSLVGESIPPSISEGLERRLGIPVLNRGSRLEIVPGTRFVEPNPRQLLALEAEIVSGLEALDLTNDPEGSFL